MNQTQTITAPKTISTAPVCRTVPLQRLPGADRRDLASCKAPVQDSLETLKQASSHRSHSWRTCQDCCRVI